MLIWEFLSISKDEEDCQDDKAEEDTSHLGQPLTRLIQLMGEHFEERYVEEGPTSKAWNSW